MAKFRIPPPGEKFQDNDILTKSPKDVPENIRFPSRYAQTFTAVMQFFFLFRRNLFKLK